MFCHKIVHISKNDIARLACFDKAYPKNDNKVSDIILKARKGITKNFKDPK